MKEIELGVYHQGCWGSESSAAFPEVSAREKGPITIMKRQNGKTTAHVTWDIRAQDKKSLENYLNFVKNHKGIMDFEVFNKTDNSAITSTIQKCVGSSYDTIVNGNCLYTAPIVQENGYERHKVLARNPKELIGLLNELEILGEVKVFRAGNFREDRGEPLTGKQFSALEIAQMHNYYSWPRNVTLEELAGFANCSRRAFQENLRKAEAKVFPGFIKNLKGSF
ncbi:MAG: helix-turn-helix domain-containing protein [Candidatus Diapherotrites archaeon]